MPAAAILVCAAGDRLLRSWRAPSAAVAGRTLMLALLVGYGGFVQTTPSPFARTARTLEVLADFPSPSVRAGPPSAIERVVAFVEANTAPGEPVLFLPNDAAFYYLADRPNPTRFALSHQIIGEAHRREVVRDLRRAPPRFVVWNDRALAVDDIPHSTVLGEEFMRWLEAGYALDTRIDSFRILRRQTVPEELAEP